MGHPEPESCAGFCLDLGALGRCASVFLYWRTSQVRQCNLDCFRFFCLTSFVHIFFIRYPFYANTESISNRIPRRTQWRNPFPLILTFTIKYSLNSLILIFEIIGCYILPSLKDFAPEISKLRRMYILTSNHPSTQPSNTGIHCPYKISNAV